MSGTDWRGLCEELASWIERATRHCFQGPEVLDRARAALAQPEPEVVEPTDVELMDLHDWMTDEWAANHDFELPPSQYARAALARWGNHPAKPDSSAPAPVDPQLGPFSEHDLRQQWNQQADEFNQWDSLDSSEQLAWAQVCAIAALAQPKPEMVGPMLQLPEQAPDEHPPSNLDRREVAAWYHGHGCGWQAARAVLARWGRPAPVPAGERQAAPVPVEVANPWKDVLIDALVCAFLLNKENASDPKKALHDIISWEIELSKDPSINPSLQPAPVAVSERLPQPEDCDAEGRCWWFLPSRQFKFLDQCARWSLMAHSASQDDRCRRTHWLPAHALPLPSGEVEHD